MEKMNSDVNAKRNDRQSKQYYEKPRLTSVMLFADQVLGLCKDPIGGADPCGDPVVSG